MNVPDSLADDAPSGKTDRPDARRCAADGCTTDVDPVQAPDGTWLGPTDLCDDCQARQTRHRQLQEIRTRRFKAAWRKAGIPKNVADDLNDESVTLDERIKGALQPAIETPPTGGSFPCATYLHGPVGSGKTTAACWALKAYLRRWRRNEPKRIEEYGDDYDDAWGRCTARFAPLVELLADKRESFGGGKEVQMQTYREADFLVLDDLGREQPSKSGWAAEQIYLLVNYRVNERLPTVFTSNYPVHGLPEGNRDTTGGETRCNYDDRVVSRILQMCGSQTDTLYHIELSGDYRRERRP